MFDKLKQMKGQCKWEHLRSSFVMDHDILTLSTLPHAIRASVSGEVIAYDKNVLAYTADQNVRQLSRYYTEDMREVLIAIKQMARSDNTYAVFNFAADLLDELDDVELELRQSWFDKSGFKFKE